VNGFLKPTREAVKNTLAKPFSTYYDRGNNPDITTKRRFRQKNLALENSSDKKF